jgi:hypothetical protein
MKNQYVGDVNDYRKYGLLKLLSGNGRLSTAVCWMLTVNDTRADGKFIEYLSNSSEWRQHDPEIYDVLQNIVLDKESRDVQEIEDSQMIPSTNYYSKNLTDNENERTDYIKEFHGQTNSCDLIFFDPDNGIEIKSTKYGRKDSSKFIYWNEIEDAYSKGHSLLIYQHFRRVQRDVFIKSLLDEMKERTGVSEFLAFRTANVVFFLVPQERHMISFEESARLIEEQWIGQIVVEKHTI